MLNPESETIQSGFWYSGCEDRNLRLMDATLRHLKRKMTGFDTHSTAKIKLIKLIERLKF
jgi:hypothetical protein